MKFKMKQFFLFLTVILVLLMTSCKDDPDIINGEEVITTLNYTLTPDDGGTDVVLSFRDLDGDGGNDPVVTSGTLSANQTYTGSITLLNESVTPAENITEEIEEEDEDHQFFFQSSLSNVTVAYTDQDSDGNPIGLSSTLTTGAASAAGTLTIILRHEPIKTASGVANGEIANAGGETDIEVAFTIDVQ